MNMIAPKFRNRVAAALVALVSIAGLTIATVAPASALPITWSGASDLLQSDGRAVISAITTAADGAQLVAAQVRQNFPATNTNGLAVLRKAPGSNSFDPAVWVVNAPTDPSGSAHSVSSLGMQLIARATDTVALWLSVPEDGNATPPAVAASIYSGGTWSAPAYLEAPGASNSTTPAFVLRAGGAITAVLGDASTGLVTADLSAGGVWGSFSTIAGANIDPNAYIDPEMTVAADGTLWIAYSGSAGIPSVIGSSGSGWGSPAVLGEADPDFGDNFSLAMAPDGAGGMRPLVAFSETPFGGGDPSLKLSSRNADGTWTTETIAPAAAARTGLVLGASADGSLALGAIDYTGAVLLMSSSGVGQPWTAPVDLAPQISGVLSPGYVAMAANARGDIVLIIPTVTGTSPNAFGEIWLTGIRAGSGSITEPVLISTETLGENQGAVALSLDLSNFGDALTISWSSFDDDASGSYGLFWLDAAGAFPSVPAIPTDVVATVGPDGVTLACTAPVDAGSTAIARYDYRYSTDGGATWSSPVTIGASPCGNTITGLAAGTYVFQVRAVSATGTGPWSQATASVDVISSEAVPAFAG